MSDIVFNHDLSWYIWKFISFNDVKKTSLVSKNFANLYNSTSFNDLLKLKYYELNDSKKYCIFAMNNIAKKYKYKKTQLFQDILLDNYVKNFKLNNVIDSEYFILLYDTIEFIFHGINRNFAKISNKISECLRIYPNIYLDTEAYVQILQFIINIGKNELVVNNNIYIRPILKFYSSNTESITKISIFSHIFIITDYIKTNAKNKNLIDARKIKGIELINQLKKKEMQKLCPKYFINKVSDIYK
tara:strand:- start:453 stop:1184 length:732 start_codon:yes stop_codon:yes gene_type:complete